MGAVSSSAPTTLVGSSAPAGKAIKCKLTTSASVSVSQLVEHVTCRHQCPFERVLTSLPFQRCVIHRATTTECVLLQRVVTVHQATRDQDAQVQNLVLIGAELLQTHEKMLD